MFCQSARRCRETKLAMLFSVTGCEPRTTPECDGAHRQALKNSVTTVLAFVLSHLPGRLGLTLELEEKGSTARPFPSAPVMSSVTVTDYVPCRRTPVRPPRGVTAPLVAPSPPVKSCRDSRGRERSHTSVPLCPLGTPRQYP